MHKNKLDDKKRVIFTYHALERLKESRLDAEVGLVLLHQSIEDDLMRFRDMREYKAKKYKDPARYFRNGTLLFTIIEKTNISPPESVYLVVSVFDQKLYQRRPVL